MRYLHFLILLLPVVGQAQLKSFTLSSRGDTLNRVDLKGQKQGPWVARYENVRGERGFEEEGIYVNDVKEGVWRRFSLEGDLIAVENFRFGYRDGKNVYFNNMGEPVREEFWRAIDPKSPFDTVNIVDVNDPSKIVRRQVVKVEPNSYKHGTWVYFDPQRGTIEKKEQWIMNRQVEKAKPVATGGEDDMAPIDVANEGKAETKKEKAKPKEVMEYEKKNAGKKKINVRTGSTGG